VGELGTDNAGVACRRSQQDVPEYRLAGHVVIFTVRAGDLAPDHADLGAADLLLAPVDIGDLLAEVEAIFLCQQAVGVYISYRRVKTYLAAGVSSTPSILIKLISGWVFRRPR
jgi:hypothetical protein